MSSWSEEEAKAVKPTVVYLYSPNYPASWVAQEFLRAKYGRDAQQCCYLSLCAGNACDLYRGYAGQKGFVLDAWRPGSYPLPTLIMLLDAPLGAMLPVNDKFVPYRPEYVFVASDYDLDFSEEDPSNQTAEAVKQRINRYYDCAFFGKPSTVLAELCKLERVDLTEADLTRIEAEYTRQQQAVDSNADTACLAFQ